MRIFGTFLPLSNDSLKKYGIGMESFRNCAFFQIMKKRIHCKEITVDLCFLSTEIMYILQGKLLYYIPSGRRIMLKLRTFGEENYYITYLRDGELLC